jgi:hypothetical protein
VKKTNQEYRDIASYVLRSNQLNSNEDKIGLITALLEEVRDVDIAALQAEATSWQHQWCGAKLPITVGNDLVIERLTWVHVWTNGVKPAGGFTATFEVSKKFGDARVTATITWCYEYDKSDVLANTVYASDPRFHDAVGEHGLDSYLPVHVEESHGTMWRTFSAYTPHRIYG